MSVSIKDGVIFKYDIIWDEDVRARNRYKLTYHDGKTILFKQDKTNTRYYSSPYSVILELENKIDMIIHNDTVQAARMIEALNKLKVFA